MDPIDRKVGTDALEANKRHLALAKKAVANAAETLKGVEDKLKSVEDAFKIVDGEFKVAVEAKKAADEAKKAADEAYVIAENKRNSARKEVEDARKKVHDAKKVHDEFKAEWDHAETCLKNAEKKYEIVEIMDDEDEANKPKSTGLDEDSKPKSEEGKKRGSAVVAQAAGSNKKSKNAPNDNFPDEIVVNGCGRREANGVYKRNGVVMKAPKYCKEGMRNGKQVGTFCIARNTYGWKLSDTVYQLTLYINYYNISELPPVSGWEVFRGKGPAPTLAYERS